MAQKDVDFLSLDPLAQRGNITVMYQAESDGYAFHV